MPQSLSNLRSSKMPAQCSMPNYMHTRDDLNHSRGDTWWVLREARKLNPDLTLDGKDPAWL